MKKTLIISSIIAIIFAICAIFWKTLLVNLLAFGFNLSQPEVNHNIPIAWEQFEGARSSDQPNVIVILTDDLGFNDISYFGGGMIPTPNIDKLASNSVNFVNGYAGSAVCAPSRAMIMTGRYASRFGFEFTPTPGPMARMLLLLSDQDRPQLARAAEHSAHNHHQVHDLTFEEKGLPSSEKTMADVMQQAGYHTMHIGKWHLGRTAEFTPNARGFDESLLMESGLYLPVDDPNVVNSKQDFDPIDQVLWKLLTYAVSFNQSDRFLPEGYLTDYFTDHAVNAIQANKDRPFFLYLAHWGIHTPLQATKQDYEAVSHLGSHRERVYAGMIRSVDRSIGAIMQKLEALDLVENTIVIFTSDNGGANYVGLPNLNKPYRGWKLTFFEGGIHVPFFMHWPAQFQPQNFAHPISHLDILPTIAAAANITDYSDIDLDGVNLLPHITKNITKPPHEQLIWRSGDYQSILSDNWKLHIGHIGKQYRLFNMAEDPTERQDLATQYPEKVTTLAQALADHNSEMVTPLWPAIIDSPIWLDKPLGQEINHDDDYIYWQN